MDIAAQSFGARWASTWPDALAFAAGLITAWAAGWDTGDLVWSLWLASLVVGYASIVWNLSAGLREFGGNTFKQRAAARQWLGGAVALGVGFAFGLVFFTIHFGGFHFVHSAFLQQFFPVLPGDNSANGFPGIPLYTEVVRRYWIFLPIAFVAERAAFASPQPSANELSPQSGTKALASRASIDGAGLMGPYRNVIRMHLLIFFFAAAHFAHWENFAIYAVVYAVYFFPWRVLRRENG
ncbi:MAG: DUF6498-containing protein [Opitutus sp.]